MNTKEAYYELLEKKISSQEFYFAMIDMMMKDPYFFAIHLELADYLQSKFLWQERKALLKFSTAKAGEFLRDPEAIRSARSQWTKREGGHLLEILRKFKKTKPRSWSRMPLLSIQALAFQATLPESEEPPAKNLVLEKHIDIASIRREIEQNEACWLINTARQENVIFHRDTNAIVLRVLPKDTTEFVAWDGPHESTRTPVAAAFPRTIELIEQFAREKNAGLGRIAIVRLKPHSIVFRHADMEAHLVGRNRYHLVIQSKKGSTMTSGVERKIFHEGDLFLFNNMVMHTAENQSNDWRIHAIFDMKVPQ